MLLEGIRRVGLALGDPTGLVPLRSTQHVKASKKSPSSLRVTSLTSSVARTQTPVLRKLITRNGLDREQGSPLFGDKGHSMKGTRTAATRAPSVGVAATVTAIPKPDSFATTFANEGLGPNSDVIEAQPLSSLLKNVG